MKNTRGVSHIRFGLNIQKLELVMAWIYARISFPTRLFSRYSHLSEHHILLNYAKWQYSCENIAPAKGNRNFHFNRDIKLELRSSYPLVLKQFNPLDMRLLDSCDICSPKSFFPPENNKKSMHIWRLRPDFCKL